MRHLTILLLLASLASLAQTPIEIASSLKTGGCNGNIVQVDNQAVELRNSLSPEERVKVRSDLEKEYETFYKNAYNKSFKVYETEKQKANIAKIALEANKVKWEAIGEIADDFIKMDPDPESHTVLKAMSFAGSKALDYTTDFLKDQVDEARRKSLNGLLYNVRKEHADLIDKVRNNPNIDQQTAINLLFSSNEANEQFYEGLDEKDRELFVKHMHDELKASIRAAELDNLGRDQALAGQIMANQKQMTDITNGLRKDLERTNNNIASLQNSQARMQQNLESLTSRVDLNSRDLDFIKDYLYGKMSAGDKLHAINEGWLKNLPPNEIAKETAKLELIKAREEFVATSKEYLSDAQNVLSIANNLGIKSDLLDKAQEGVNILGTGLEAFTQFSSGNILGGVASLTSLFGKKTDPVMEKLKVMDKKLDAILENQEAMKQQLIQIQEGVNKLIQGQQLLYETMIAISEKMDQQYNSLYSELHEVHLDVLYIRDQVHYYASEQKLQTIHSFVESNRKTLDVLNDSTPSFAASQEIMRPDFSQFQNFEETLYGVFNPTRIQRKTTLETRKQIFALPRDFKITEFITDDEKWADGTQKDIHKQMVADMMRMDSLFYYFLKDHNALRSIQYYTSLLAPFERVDMLDKKNSVTVPEQLKTNEQLQEILNFLDCDITSAYKTERQNNYLEPRYLMDAVDNLINYHYLYNFRNEEGKKLLEPEFINGLSIYPDKQPILKNARFLLNICIAQQVLLSGDLLIPYIYEKLNNGIGYPPFDDKSEKAKIQRLCMRILEYNDLARYNFGKYFTTRRLRELKRNITNYSIALRSEDVKLLQLALQVTDKVDWANPGDSKQLKLISRPDPRDEKNKIWCFVIEGPLGEKYFPLPSATDHLDKLVLDELQSSRMLHTNAVSELSKYKDYIDRELSKMEYIKKAKPDEKVAMNKLILLSNLSEN
jgi:L-rhamnose mutarotase